MPTPVSRVAPMLPLRNATCSARADMRATLLTILLAASAAAQTAPVGKTAILQLQNGILNTHEGHQAFGDIESKYAAKKADLDKKQNDIAALEEQLRKSSATMSDEAQRKLARDIEKKTKSFNFEAEMTRADYEQEQADAMEAVARKFHTVVDKYA